MQTIISSGVSVDLGVYNLDPKYSESVPFIRPKIVPKDYSLGFIAFLSDTLGSPNQMLSGVGLSLLVDKEGPPIHLVNPLYGSSYFVQDGSIVSVDNSGNLTPLAIGETDIILISGVGITNQDESKKANLNVRVTDFVYPVNADAGGRWGKDLLLTPYRNFTSGVEVAADAHFTTDVYISPDLYFKLHPTLAGTATLTMTDGSIVSRAWTHSMYFYSLAGKYSLSMVVGKTQTVEVDGISEIQAANLKWELIEAADDSLSTKAIIDVSLGNKVIVTALQTGQFRIKAYMDGDRFYISKAITIT